LEKLEKLRKANFSFVMPVGKAGKAEKSDF